MGTMRFVSFSTDPRTRPKVFSFDSSPGRAIGQAIGAGLWDEESYTAELTGEKGPEKIYEVRMRRLETESAPGPHRLVKVGTITYRPSF